jgi:mitochondrial chaperone BCS1
VFDFMPISESPLSSLFTDNPYFSAGFGLLGVGTGLALLRQGIIRSVGMLQRRLLTTLEITSRDPAYPWVLQWITRQRLTSGGHFSLSTLRKPKQTTINNPEFQRFQLVPAPGVHYLRWSGRWIQVSRERERSLVDFGAGTSGAGANFTAGPFETVTLMTIGKAEKVMRSLLEEAEKTNAQMEQGKLVVWTAWGQDWRPFGQPRRRRPLESVVLDEGIASRLLSDLKDFLGAESWYQSRGIPYRRGYLLDGPPGGGKSSFVQALAGELGYNICVISLSEGWLTDDRFNHLLNSLPERSFLLLEDIDATGPAREDKSDNSGGRLSFSGLLNSLDGVTSAEERIIFMTTNHRERLDPALIRPGRVDFHQHVGWATAYQARRLFLNFYPEHAHLSERFAEEVSKGEGQLSPAAIQGHFILYKNSPQEAVENLDNLFKNHQKKLNKSIN